MINFLYKIIHFELPSDHKESVLRSFYIMWAIFATPPMMLIFLIYKFAFRISLVYDILFYAVELGLMGAIYYFLVVRKSQAFIETSVGNEFYDFGKFNVVMKTVATLLLFGVVIICCRIVYVLVSEAMLPQA